MRLRTIATLLLAAFFMSILTSYTFAYQRYRPSPVTGANRWERVERPTATMDDEETAMDDETAAMDDTAIADGQECEIVDLTEPEREGNLISDTLGFAGETVSGAGGMIMGTEREDEAVSATCPVAGVDDRDRAVDDDNGGLMSWLTAPFRYTYAAGAALLGAGQGAVCP